MSANGSTAIAAWIAGAGRLPRRGRAGDRRREAIAQAVPRLDVDRLLRVVAQRLAQFLDAGDQRVVADHRAAPHAGEQLLLGHGLARPLEQRAEHQRGLARELDLGVVLPEPRGRGLESKASEGDCDCMRSRRNPGVVPGFGSPAPRRLLSHQNRRNKARQGGFREASRASSSTASPVTPCFSALSSTPSDSSAISGCRNRMDSPRDVPLGTALAMTSACSRCLPCSTASWRGRPSSAGGRASFPKRRSAAPMCCSRRWR